MPATVSVLRQRITDCEMLHVYPWLRIGLQGLVLDGPPTSTGKMPASKGGLHKLRGCRRIPLSTPVPQISVASASFSATAVQ